MIRRFAHALRELRAVLIAVGLVLITRSSLADHYVVPSESMAPTVEPRDHIVVDKIAYGLNLPLIEGNVIRFAQPSRGDVIVLDSPDDGRVLLKRVVALPGDQVTVQNGKLVLNGTPVPVEVRGNELFEHLGKADHMVSFEAGGGPPFGPLVIPPDRYLVMGDNRGNSRDSRYFGLVPRSSILGRAAAVFLRNGSPTWIGL